MRQNKLKQFPILHRFLVYLYIKCNVYAVDNMLEYIQNDVVSDYCRCSNKNCSTVYLRSDNLNQPEYIEIYNSYKGLILMHFRCNGDIKIEALDYKYYPFKEELVKNYNTQSTHMLDRDLMLDAQNIVDDYFNLGQTKIDTIVVDWGDLTSLLESAGFTRNTRKEFLVPCAPVPASVSAHVVPFANNFEFSNDFLPEFITA